MFIMSLHFIQISLEYVFWYCLTWYGICQVFRHILFYFNSKTLSIYTVQMFGIGRNFKCLWKKHLMLTKTVFYSIKNRVKQLFSSLQCHMIFQKSADSILKKHILLSIAENSCIQSLLIILMYHCWIGLFFFLQPPPPPAPQKQIFLALRFVPVILERILNKV